MGNSLSCCCVDDDGIPRITLTIKCCVNNINSDHVDGLEEEQPDISVLIKQYTW